jgi:hypothetical protein
LSTQLSDTQVVVDPLIEKINTMDPTSPQVIAVKASVAIHITQDLQGYLNEPKRHFKEFMQELRNIVSSIAVVIP